MLGMALGLMALLTPLWGRRACQQHPDMGAMGQSLPRELRDREGPALPTDKQLRCSPTECTAHSFLKHSTPRHIT